MHDVIKSHCGECTACCTVLNINTDQLSKPAMETCVHCDQGKGCSIYESRPSVCKTWECLYLKLDWPDFTRPDMLGAMFSLEPDPHQNNELIAVVRTVTEDLSPLLAENTKVAVKGIMESGTQVWLSSGGTKHLVEKGKAYPFQRQGYAVDIVK